MEMAAYELEFGNLEAETSSSISGFFRRATCRLRRSIKSPIVSSSMPPSNFACTILPGNAALRQRMKQPTEFSGCGVPGARKRCASRFKQRSNEVVLQEVIVQQFSSQQLVLIPHAASRIA